MSRYWLVTACDCYKIYYGFGSLFLKNYRKKWQPRPTFSKKKRLFRAVFYAFFFYTTEVFCIEIKPNLPFFVHYKFLGPGLLYIQSITLFDDQLIGLFRTKNNLFSSMPLFLWSSWQGSISPALAHFVQSPQKNLKQLQINSISSYSWPGPKTFFTNRLIAS